ncbi:MAG: PSD1 and planctomycete cytochrome C domain-containing protein [Pirellulaceae bacterium]|nr:PSD1 and planctomycete cytochrome C domain-containing protein [Pirellulaceae bacterium]
MSDARSIRSIALCAVVLCGAASSRAEEATTAAAAEELFERQVRPLLVEACQKCHGPDKQESDFRVDSRKALLRGGYTGPAIVPGKPAESLLLAAVRHEGDFAMPPKTKLPDDKIAALESWIKLGAPWPASAATTAASDARAKSHWAFQPIRDPPVPEVAPLAAVGTDDVVSPQNPIDAFWLEKLHAAKLAPSPQADRRTLIRRLSFDLLGLPPTPDDVEAFVADPDPRAYERLVDRLLASPHYGEQWGRHWLDVARYSDTKGYVYAREQRFWVHAWPYRDWVVRSLNEDLPYDQFLLLQIAADQVVDRQQEAERANLAAMGFLTLGRRFIGVTHDIIDDRIDVVTRSTMGLTVACARCHDHKYDPIPTRDYYSLYGVFQNCAERQVPIAESPAGPTVPADQYAAFAEELKKREDKLASTLAEKRTEASNRVRSRVADYLYAQLEMQKYPDEGFDQVLTKDDVIPAFVRRWQAYLSAAADRNDTVFAAWRVYVQIPAEDFSAKSAEATAALLSRPEAEVHPRVRALFESPPASHQEVAERYGKLLTEIDGQWQALVKTAAENKAPSPTALPDAGDEALRQVLYGPAAPCEIPDEPIVNIETFFDLGTVDQLWKQQGEVDSWLLSSPLAPPHAMILVDRQPLVDARVFRRGRPANKGELAPRQFLELLSGENRQPFAQGSGRLELARAIIAPANPLTARVAVNRVWMHHFGAGLVDTPSDFGTRAKAPSHPELLDWLASRLIEEGWSLKKLHRRILLSAAYRQASQTPVQGSEFKVHSSGSTPTLNLEPATLNPASVDPENRLLWRMNPRRLSFEQMRDAALATSGELDLARGGKATDLFAADFRRRTLYGQVDRQFLPGTLRVFDFANPDLHIPQRSDTTVPQQALFFLNDKLLLERARQLAARAGEDQSPELRIQQIFRLALLREPTADEAAAALSLVTTAETEPADEVPPTAADWQYGFAAFDEAAGKNGEFHPLPHFTGSAWQGGSKWPDGKLGWVQLTAAGGHAGNDHAHAAVRRWVAPRKMTIRIRSKLVHDTEAGDGVRGRVVSSRHGLVGMASVHNGQAELAHDSLAVEPGDTLDFALDIGGNLNNDQFTWDATIEEVVPAAGADTPPTPELPRRWNSRTDFHGPSSPKLGPWEQLAQVLLSANEFVFVD